MRRDSRKLVVVGQGGARLAAALSAAEQARSLGVSVEIALLEKSREDEAGGNTRCSPGNIACGARCDFGKENSNGS